LLIAGLLSGSALHRTSAADALILINQARIFTLAGHFGIR
jgi:hypothetical protein